MLKYLLFVVVAVSSRLDEWNQWKHDNEKYYASKLDEEYRYMVWNNNYDTILEHNSDHTHTYKLGLNKFSDLTVQEFRNQMTGVRFQDQDQENKQWMPTNICSNMNYPPFEEKRMKAFFDKTNVESDIWNIYKKNEDYKKVIWDKVVFRVF